MPMPSVRTGEAGERSAVRNAAPGAQSGVRSGAQDATSDGTRATAPQLQPPPLSKKSSRFIRANYGNRAASPQPGKAVQRAASDRPE